MKTRLVKWLACPECLGDIRLEAIEQDRSAEVYTGLLLCDACRFIYPVYDGVPRMLPYFLDDYNKFIQNNRVVIEKNSGYSFPSGTVIKGEEATQRSFSKEWAECDYSGVLWNYTYEQLQQLFLWEIDMEPAKLKGKLIFDGGCGNGMFGDLISANGAEVVGMDLSSGVVSSYKKFINNGNVHFVQGTLFKPPFKPGIFDIVYSHGAMHHTYDTRKAFMSIASLCKNGGRYYVWLYGEYTGVLWLFHKVTNSVRFLVSRLPPPLQDPVVTFLAAIYGFVRRMFRRYATKSPGVEYNRTQTLHVTRDRFTPLYAHIHSADEVTRWFKKAGFPNPVFRPHLFDNPRYEGGIAVYGDRQDRQERKIG